MSALASTPFERQLRAAGARFTQQDGWCVATDFGSVSAEVAVCRRSVGIADVSQVGKLRVHAPPHIVTTFVDHGEGPLDVGVVIRTAEGLWGHPTAEELLAIVPPSMTAGVCARLEQTARRRPGSRVVDDTRALAALALLGPRAHRLADELLQGGCDWAEQDEYLCQAPVAGVSTIVCRHGVDRYVLLFDAGAAETMWAAVFDAGEPLQAACVGTSALRLLDAAVPTTAHSAL